MSNNYQLQEANHRTGLLAVEIDEQSVKIIIIDPFILFIKHQNTLLSKVAKEPKQNLNPKFILLVPKVRQEKLSREVLQAVEARCAEQVK